jgi:hypothetical protein
MNPAEIENFIREEKIITNPPSKDFKEEGQHFRKDFDLTSSDGARKFSVFLRRNKNFQENFSIGLICYLPEGSTALLIRLNGDHGEVVENPLKPSPHFGYHIHRISPVEFERGIADPKFSSETKEYASFEQALAYFCKIVNIKNADEYFANAQTELFQS